MENPSEIISGFNLSLDQGIAENLGVDAALVYNHIIYWLRINAAKPNPEKIEDKFWMYETQKEMADFFGFYSEDQINKAIKKLIESGLIIAKPLDKNPFNRKYFYTVYDQGLIKKSLRNPENDGIGNPNSAESETLKSAESETLKSAECIYTTKETKENQKKTTTTRACASDAVDLIFSDKEKEQLNNFTPEQIEKATLKTNQDCVQKANHSRVKFFFKVIDSLPKKSKPKPTVYEELKKTFQNGCHYRDAECNLNAEGISFTRGMKCDYCLINKFWSWDKFKAMCDDFGIKFDRA